MTSLQKKEFPETDLPELFNFTTCAVVGSALDLLKKRRGREIDAHGTIFRSNQAPTKGMYRHTANPFLFPRSLPHSLPAAAAMEGMG